jgi:hypothetical protein
VVDITGVTLPKGLCGVGLCHWEDQLSPGVSEGSLRRVLCCSGLYSLMTRDPETKEG